MDKVKPSDNLTDTAEQIVRSNAKSSNAVKKRGSKSASVEATTTASKDDIKQMMSNVLYWYKMPIVKSDDECAERLNMFFDRISQTGEVPTVEKLCLALGTVRTVVWEWEQGSRGQIRADMIKRAKEIMAALDAELVSKGKIPQVTYIFRAKNFFGMRDQAEYIITPNTPLGNEMGQKELEEHLNIISDIDSDE